MPEPANRPAPDETTTATAIAVGSPLRVAGTYPIVYRPAEHEQEILSYFSEPDRTLVADRSPLPVDWSLVVCFVNRSGSNWLADLLAATKKAGRAGEYLNHDVVARQCAERGHPSFDGYLRWLAKRTGRGGCFAFKAGIGQLHFLRRTRIIPDIIPNPRYVLCRRKDIAAQALSLVKAAHTLEWRRLEGDEPVPFDYDTISNRQILETIRSIADQYASFESFFSTFGIDYVSVVYEDLLADTPDQFARITEDLGIEVDDPAALIAGARTSVMQRDDASEQRLRRFHAAMQRR